MKTHRHVLMWVSSPEATSGSRGTLRWLMDRIEDRSRLVEMAEAEGVAGLLYRGLLEAGLLDRLDHEQRAALEAQYHRTAALTLQRIHDLVGLLDALEVKEVRVVLLKGMSLLPETYEDIGLRPISDIDLWVMNDHHQRVVDTLLDRGYERELLYPNTFRKGLTAIDLHAHLLGADRIRSRTLLLKKGQEAIFRNCRKISFEGRIAWCLERHDQVLHLCLHLLKHNAGRLIWLVDLKRLVSGWDAADWQALKQRAEEMGQEKAVSSAFYLVRQLLDGEAAPSMPELAGFGRLHVLERMTLRRRMRKGALPVWAPLFFYSPRHGLTGPLANILETLFPRPEILKQIIADAENLSHWRLYWRRFFHLLGMLARSSR